MSTRSAMLTPAQRKYLRGEKDYVNRQTRASARYKIRTQVRQSLLDFVDLACEMDARDRKQLLKDVRPAVLRDDDDLITDEAYRDDETTALVYAMGFLLQTAKEVGYNLELLIQHTLAVSGSMAFNNPLDIHTVDVSIERTDVTEQLSEREPLELELGERTDS